MAGDPELVKLLVELKDIVCWGPMAHGCVKYRQPYVERLSVAMVLPCGHCLCPGRAEGILDKEHIRRNLKPALLLARRLWWESL